MSRPKRQYKQYQYRDAEKRDVPRSTVRYRQEASSLSSSKTPRPNKRTRLPTLSTGTPSRPSRQSVRLTQRSLLSTLAPCEDIPKPQSGEAVGVQFEESTHVLLDNSQEELLAARNLPTDGTEAEADGERCHQSSVCVPNPIVHEELATRSGEPLSSGVSDGEESQAHLRGESLSSEVVAEEEFFSMILSAGTDEEVAETSGIGVEDDNEDNGDSVANDSGDEEILAEGPLEDNGDSDSNDSGDEDILAEEPLNIGPKNLVNLLLLLATKKRHNLSYPAAENLMELAGILSESEDEPFLPSKHIMKEVIKHYSSSVTVHHVCPSCKFYIGTIERESFECPNCTQLVDTATNKKKNNIFLYLSISEQIRNVLEHSYSDIVDPEARCKISRGNYEDIYDGSIYKAVQRVEKCLTLNFFVDGVQIATTNKSSAWPVLLLINELPMHLRRKYMILGSLWLNRKKPDMGQYLKPFVQESIEMATTGITFKHNGVFKRVLVKPLMCVSDSVARPLLRNSMQFNGEYGCGLCYHPGFHMVRGRGHCRSYSIANTGPYPVRSHEQTVEHAISAELLGVPQYGICGQSILSQIPGFNIVRGLDLDLFHALVNTAKRFANLWFSKPFRGQPYSLYHRFAVVNRRLMCITPTSDVSRAPRPLTERSDYRGHEWYYWVIIYSIPCLKNLLPQRYLNHWSLLVTSLALVMQNSVAKSEVAYAGRYLLEFSQGIHDLYGMVHVTFSSHLLTHLERSIQDFGQPWTHSAFIFESFNQEIKNSVKSANGAAIQIIKNIQLKEALKKLTLSLKDTMSPAQKLYLEKITTAANTSAPYNRKIGEVHFLGKPKAPTQPAAVVQALRLSRIQCKDEETLVLYERIQIEGEIYHGLQYKKCVKQNNYTVMLQTGDIFEIDSFVIVSDKCIVLGYYLVDSDYKMCDSDIPHIRVLQEEHEGFLRAVPVSHIDLKLLSFPVRVSNALTVRVACTNVLLSEMLT